MNNPPTTKPAQLQIHPETNHPPKKTEKKTVPGTVSISGKQADMKKLPKITINSNTNAKLPFKQFSPSDPQSLQNQPKPRSFCARE
jgi:hypothetical protein